MATSTRKRNLENLISEGDWGQARKLIEKKLVKDPENHWLITQLGNTWYEQEQYREALPFFLSSLEIVPDCPLTLWNIAGTLDALGKQEPAISIYTWLLRSKKTPADDPCWESQEWRDSLKTDCVYRLGMCFQHMERWESAENCFRQYINLLLAGSKGTYSFDDAAHHFREVHARTHQRVEKDVKDAINLTLRDAGVESTRAGRRQLPGLSLSELLAT